MVILGNHTWYFGTTIAEAEEALSVVPIACPRGGLAGSTPNVLFFRCWQCLYAVGELHDLELSFVTAIDVNAGKRMGSWTPDTG